MSVGQPFGVTLLPSYGDICLVVYIVINLNRGVLPLKPLTTF
ncbi:hypothetical protein BTHERMOSOX_1630 [Bathymodiolus thermophilus thioautotrophic gill symbiont]|nr:hypothetical protein BTHERMOSOX_1630 [Bathymodiolus thermophilus thioautotrophic gill symbiont]